MKMPGAYSDDLCRKALSAVERELSKKEVCAMFDISLSSLHLWISGSYNAKIGYQKGCGHSITDLKHSTALFAPIQIRLRQKWQHYGRVR